MTDKERANIYPVRLYKDEVFYIDFLSQVTGDTRGKVLRKIIRQHMAAAKANRIEEKKVHAVSDDGLYDITIIHKPRQ